MRAVVCFLLLLVALAGFCRSVRADDQHGRADSGEVGRRVAADEAHGTVSGAHDAHHGESHEPPSMFAGLLDLTIWTIVIFVLLLLVLGKFAWRPMLEGLQKREDSIRQALEEAEKARAEAAALRSQHQVEMNKVQETVRGIMEEAHRNATRTTEEMITKARSEIQTERDRLRREIEVARDQALQEIWGQAASLATMVASKAVRKELTSADHHRLVDEAINELRQAGAEYSQYTGNGR